MLAAGVWLAAASGLLSAGTVDAQAETIVARNSGGALLMRIDGWQVSPPSTPTLAGGLKALGRGRLSSQIRTTRGRVSDPASCIVDYRRRRAVLQFTTLGGIPPGSNGCRAQRRVYLADAVFSGRRWRTDRGLRVGQRVRRLKRLYPHAGSPRAPANPVLGRRSYWLVARISPYGDNQRVPVLEAVVSNGRVRRLVLHVGAQGD